MNQTEKGASGWTVETLFVHFTALIGEAEKHNNQRFADQEKAVQAALAAAKEASNAALVAQQTAVNKAETALVGWKESQNEWRGTIADIISKTAGKSSGLNSGWGYLIGAVGLLLAIIGIFSAFKH